MKKSSPGRDRDAAAATPSVTGSTTVSPFPGAGVTPRRLAVVALGGNALLGRDDPPDAAHQRANLARAAEALAGLAAEYDLVVTHGNGPQVGLLARQTEDLTGVAPYPLDVLGAETEGMIGYLIEQELGNALPGRQIATLLTQVVVNRDDPAFASPSKPVGAFYDEDTARQLSVSRGWKMAPSGGRYRRVVPSPRPQSIREIDTIRLLVAAGVVVICAGGGGVPVTENGDGTITGVEAVVDKDLSSALLATLLGADALVLLTDVDAVYADWRGPAQRAIRTATPEMLRAMAFEPGSMGPKVEAVSGFVAQTGGFAAIGAIADAGRLLNGEAGTLVRRADEPPRDAGGG